MEKTNLQNDFSAKPLTPSNIDRFKGEKANFVNCCNYTREFIATMERIARPRHMTWLYWILVVLFTFLIVIQASAEKWGSVVLIAVVFAFTTFIQFALPKLQAKHLLAQMKAMNGTISQVETLFYDSGIRTHNLTSDAKSDVDYDRIVKIVCTQDLYLLGLKPQVYMLIDRSGFLEGREADFEAFIRQKAVGAKFQVRK